MNNIRSIFWRSFAFAFALPVLAGLTGCTTPAPGTPEAELAARENRMEAVEKTTDDIPSWFINMPIDSAALFSGGTATSSDLQLAMDKAVLNAKRSLADRINSTLSSKMKEFLSETGSNEDAQVMSEVERITSNLITEVNVSGYSRDKTDVKPTGTQYRAYVLLRYPLGKANQILVDQVKKNGVVEARVRASKAFQELEAEIKSAKGTVN